MRVRKHHEQAVERKRILGPSLPKKVDQLPNWGIIIRRSGYKPIIQSKNFMELNLVHYTSEESYNHIKKAFQEEDDCFIWPDETGWSFFLDYPLRTGLKMVRSIRRALGIRVPRHGEDKVYYVKIPSRLPLERVWINEERIAIEKEMQLVAKYAVAEGILRRDVADLGRVYGGEYKLGHYSKVPPMDRW